MEQLYPWLGDLNRVLDRPWAGLVCMVFSVLCGVFIGVEREKRDKPAGLRTVVLICVGSTIFTLVSLLVASAAHAEDPRWMADPARIASQIVPGIGFLGAGAIIQSRGNVLGLTTAATIWTVAAIGVTIGSGYVAAGIAFTMVVFLALTALQPIENKITGACRLKKARVVYTVDGGKTRPRLQHIIDRYEIPDGSVVDAVEEASGQAALEFPYCVSHRDHRSVLKELADVKTVERIEAE